MAENGFRRWAAYRLATVAGAFTNTVFGLIRSYITVGAIGAAGGTLAGYTAAQGLTYAWLGQAFLSPLALMGWNELAQRVRTGDIAVDLARPIDPQLAYLTADLGRAAYSLIPRGAPPLLAGALLFELAFPASVLPYVLGVVSLTIAVMISFACRWIVNLTAFWLIEMRGVLTLYMLTSGFLSGHLIPVHWFPSWLKTIANATPFPSMVQTPIDVTMGFVAGAEALKQIGIQVIWLIAMLAIGRLVFASGTKKLVVQGG
jgi:ABC-2 type transport system permease protein